MARSLNDYIEAEADLVEMLTKLADHQKRCGGCRDAFEAAIKATHAALMAVRAAADKFIQTNEAPED